MKTYEVLINGMAVNDYILGRISGVIHAVTGMSERGYAWVVSECGRDCTMKYDATEAQHKTIVDYLNKFYFHAFAGAKVVE